MENILNYQDFFDRNFTEISAYGFESQTSVGRMLAADSNVTSISFKGTSLSGIGPAEDTEYNDNPHEDSPVQGYDWTGIIKKWTQAVSIPKSTWMGCPNAAYLVDKYKAEGQMSALGQSFNDRIDTDFADLVNRGTTVTTPDGVALFSASHPVNSVLSTTYNTNYLASGAAPTTSAAESLLQYIGKISDDKNQPANLNLRYPIYMMAPPDQEGVTRRICQTMGTNQSYAGNANNDRNVLPLMGLQPNPIIWPRLSTRYDANGSTTGWYMVIPGLSFKVFWLSGIEFKSWIKPLVETYYFYAEAWFVIKLIDYRGIYKG